jgi:tetratricopeptide (TPR) repeat protein
VSNLNPTAADAGLEQALADFDAGNLPAAADASRTLLEQRPHDRQVLRLAAAIAMSERRFQECEQLLNRALAASATPQQQAEVWNSSGQLGRAVNNLDHAEEAHRRAMLLDAAESDHAIQFAETLGIRGKIEPAIDVLRSTIARHPREAQPCVSLGNMLVRAGRQRDALAFYDMALQRDANSAAAHFNAGVALTMLGKLDAARAATETALKLDPGMSGYYQLASLGGLKAGHPTIERLEALAEREGGPSQTRMDAGFALARVYDESGQYDEAFHFLAKANELKRASLDYRIEDDEERIDRIRAFFTRDFFERFRGAVDSKLAPIFILGMPRSGTTLVEQMLASHSKVEGGGELNTMGEIARDLGETWGARGEASPGTEEQVRSDLNRAAAAYTRATQPLQRRHPHFTDKMPGNYMFIGLIHLMFPDARIIHCRRDPVDTCLSCFQKPFSSEVPYSYDLTELGRYYRLYQKLMAHWEAVLPPGRILDVDYESMVEEPEQGLRRILAFCGLDYEAGCLEFQDAQRAVTTASAVQVRQGLYKTSVQRWKKYASQLGPLLTALGIDPAKT